MHQDIRSHYCKIPDLLEGVGGLDESLGPGMYNNKTINNVLA